MILLNSEKQCIEGGGGGGGRWKVVITFGKYRRKL
jgi:hypothetical protein